MSSIISWLLQNWYLVIIGFIVVLFIGSLVVKFFNLPPEKRYKKIRQWLLWAVCEAEKELGSGTGQIKLRLVYDMFITKFPFMSKILKFETFSKLVDDALKEMKELLEKNYKIQAAIAK